MSPSRRAHRSRPPPPESRARTARVRAQAPRSEAAGSPASPTLGTRATCQSPVGCGRPDADLLYTPRGRTGCDPSDRSFSFVLNPLPDAGARTRLGLGREVRRSFPRGLRHSPSRKHREPIKVPAVGAGAEENEGVSHRVRGLRGSGKKAATRGAP